MKIKSLYLLALPIVALVSCTIVDNEPRAVRTSVVRERFIRTIPVKRERVITERPLSGETVVTYRPVNKEIRDIGIRDYIVTENRGIIRRAPPKPRLEALTRRPTRNHVYTAGHWHWNGSDFEWIPGYWIRRVSKKSVWHDGEWVSHRIGYSWKPGRWTN